MNMIKLWRHPSSIGLASFLLATAAHAGFELDGLERFGGVKVEGYLEYQDYDFSKSVVRSDALGFHDAGLNTLDHASELAGLHISLPYVSANALVKAIQHSTYDGTTLRFQATNNISISSNAGIGALFGTATATSNFQATFLINSDTSITLKQSSELGPTNFGGVYTFSLAKDTGEIAWNRSSLVTPEGQPIYSFEQRLTLTPGFYILNASLKAIGGVDPSMPDAHIVASAMFAMSVVPEPDAALLLTTSLIMAGMMRWRGARLQAVPT